MVHSHHLPTRYGGQAPDYSFHLVTKSRIEDVLTEPPRDRVKMDVEGAEWDSILRTPDEVLARIDQLVFEFHGVARDTARYLEVVGKLKRTFEIVHLHFNNYSCTAKGAPFRPGPTR